VRECSVMQWSEDLSCVEYSGVKWIGGQSVRGLLQFCRCEPLLLEYVSWSTRIVLEPRVRGTSAVESRYPTTTGEDTGHWEDLMHAVVNCWVCELVIVPELLVVTVCKSSVNPINNHFYSHSYTWLCIQCIYIYIYTLYILHYHI
jgi:hypothetical protein